jgi:hypothetical protein
MDNMRRRFVAPAVLILATPLFAEVTVHYNTDFKLGTFLPPAMADQVRSSGLGALDGPTVIRIKGDKAYTSIGKFSFITDFATNQVTYIDSENSRFATVPVGELASKLADSMPQLPKQAAGLNNMFKADVQSRKTGRSEVIRGVRAEEYEVIVALTLSLPDVPANSGPAVRMIMQIWRANAEEAASNPALAEFMRYSSRSESSMNPADVMRKLTGPLQSLGQSFSAIREEMMKEKSPALRIHMEESSPMLALAPQGAGGGPASPLVSFDQEMVEFSTAPVEDSVFLTPAGFKNVALEEILKDQFAKFGAQAR